MLIQKTKLILFISLVLIILGFLFVLESQRAGRLRMIFCDIGQGDGMLVVTPDGKQIVIDGGPGTKIVDCLSSKMPFWDHTIEMMFLTHPQQDHMQGQIEIFKRYKVEKVGWTTVENETELFKQWQQSLKEEGSQVYVAKADDRLNIKKLSIDILWPSQDKLNQWQYLRPEDLNETSIVLRLEYHEPGSGYSSPAGEFCAYLTGDLPKEILEALLLEKCQLLKISHHGSKTGTNQQILDSIDPEIAIIQVGKNRFGHPHQEVLDLLQSKNIKVLRNDKHGIIEIETDGNRFSSRVNKK